MYVGFFRSSLGQTQNLATRLQLGYTAARWHNTPPPSSTMPKVMAASIGEGPQGNAARCSADKVDDQGEDADILEIRRHDQHRHQSSSPPIGRSGDTGKEQQQPHQQRGVYTSG